MNAWDLIATIYGVVAIGTLLPVLIPMCRSTKSVPDAAAVACPHDFSEEARQELSEYYSTILGELGSWRKRAKIYNRFHYYCVCWPIFSSWLIPFIGTLAGAEAKWLIVVASSHAALALSFYNVLKVGENMLAFRYGEPEFLDLNRQLAHRPLSLGKTEREQLNAYVDAAEDIRKKVRAAETVGLAYVEHGDNRRG